MKTQLSPLWQSDICYLLLLPPRPSPSLSHNFLLPLLLLKKYLAYISNEPRETHWGCAWTLPVIYGELCFNYLHIMVYWWGQALCHVRNTGKRKYGRHHYRRWWSSFNNIGGKWNIKVFHRHHYCTLATPAPACRKGWRTERKGLQVCRSLALALCIHKVGGVSPFKTLEMFPFLINNDITKDIKDKLLNKSKI